MFGGGGFGLLSFLPMLFFGRRGGCSFGCLPFLCIALVCLCLFSAGGIGGGGLYPGYSNVPQFPADNNSGNPVNVNQPTLNPGGFRPSNNGSGSDLSNFNTSASLNDEPPAIQTQTARDLTELHAAFDSRIPEWQNQLTNNQAQSIPPADAGLTQDNNTKEVLYGKCGSAFYVYVVLATKPDVINADGEGYIYTTASSPGACHPAQWTVYQSEDVGGNWYYALLKNGQ